MRRHALTGLLLGVSVICLAMVAPTAVLSQSQGQAGCGSADVDGVLSAGEWDAATKLALVSNPPEVGASHVPTDATGTLYLLNDEGILYVGTKVDFELMESDARTSGIVLEPGEWSSSMCLLFTDEGNALDNAWQDPDCGSGPEDFPEEGQICAETNWEDWMGYKAWSQTSPCCGIWMLADGVAAVGASGGEQVTLVWEWAVDLANSKLNQIQPGECFRFGAWVYLDGSDPILHEGEALWPGGLAAPRRHADYMPEQFSQWPSSFGTICLNDCLDREFVPEPATMLLLGSGVMGLAGYATLRVRSRKALH